MKFKRIMLLASSVLLFVHCESRGDASGREDMKETGPRAGYAMAAVKGGTENVDITTKDGIRITGTLYPAGAKAPAVLCLHQWRSDRASFAGLATTLQSAGFTVLAIDMRGYGGSTRTSSGGVVRPDRKARPDVEAAIAFLRGHAMVEASRIGIIGASYGSSNAIQYAAGDKGIKAVVLLSPGLNYFNELPTEDAVKSWGAKPMLAVASSEDIRSVETLQAYAKLARSTESKVYENAGHGTDMLAAGSGLDKLILDYLKKNL